MTRRTSRLATSATPALADVATLLDNPDDAMSLDVPEQLLTPENSRSETSSNNENALTEENPSSRRSQAYVDSLANSKRSRSSLRHSIAVMESSIRTKVLPDEDTVMEDASVVPDTPISNSSQELQSEDLGVSLQQRTLRKRLHKEVGEEDAGSAKGTPKVQSTQSPRRSSRLSIVNKASDFLDRASSVLGKSGKDPNTKGKEVGRRASLRPRNVAPPKEEMPTPAPEPAQKKRRVSESDLPTSKEKDTPSEEPAPLAPQRFKRKVWLTHGLYSGQEETDSPPKQRRRKSSTKNDSSRSIVEKGYPSFLFAGARLLEKGRDFRLPYDIFSPLPPGQPKPNEWRKTNKNVFVGDAADEWKATKKLELSTCMCSDETGCDEDCQNRYMFYECDNGNCRVGPDCGNRNFSELKARTKAGGKFNIGVEVIKTEDRGYGVRSNRAFDPNQIIVEYTGEIITQQECERRMRTVYKKNDCYYLMYFDQNMIIDATRGSIARFVNHSCEPNCRMEKWTVAGKPRMALFAGDQGIMTGEELSYDYNFDPYSNKNVQECRCGAEKCRGILGPRPKDRDQRANAEGANGKKTVKAGTKRKREATSAATSVAKKRKVITQKSIKAGVKKAVAKATTARGKVTRKTPASASRSPAKGKAEGKKPIKLPKVKAAARVKAAVRAPRKAEGAKASSKSPAKVSQLKRPSAETKKRILANAAKGSKPASKKSPAKAAKPAARKAPSKSPVKAKVLAQAKKTPTKSTGVTRRVRNAAKSVVRVVKGGKK
ncbi:Histone-lysine N-methyltransferase (Ash1) [Penicillium chermesinum]|uniref:Histone-lysine N-methyltransferase (Ash1) n=1 Tax=Penicillium chermesinum TaxID=63820 RepID=A0A9W9NJM7_9EURO|nr:Histone-lysine N-methyltransferase (Ash1) [Penicillium chermesinum]KAJ5219894.1 Histone-lysine N-methyltransferase (Ash1) [Penicillium chermesinum]